MWDNKRREGLNTEWGRVYAEETKQILVDLQNGSMDALRQVDGECETTSNYCQMRQFLYCL